MNINQIIEKTNDASYGIGLFTSDEVGDELKKLINTSHTSITLEGTDKSINVQIIPILYVKSYNNEWSEILDLTANRDHVIHTLFERWNVNHKSKKTNPYQSKTFMDYALGMLQKADYAIILEDKE